MMFLGAAARDHLGSRREAAVLIIWFIEPSLFHSPSASLCGQLFEHGSFGLGFPARRAKRPV